MIYRARARVVMFPELSLTGYELDAPVVTPSDSALAILGETCRDTRCVALIGAPVPGAAHKKHIGVLRVDPGGISIAYCKSFLGGEEPDHFSTGDGPAAIEIDGWRIGLGVCKDTGVEQHINDTAALGIDLYLAGLVDQADDRAIQERRAQHIARTCGAWVGFASFAGPTGGGFTDTVGLSSVWDPTGQMIVSASARPNDFARMTLTPPRLF